MPRLSVKRSPRARPLLRIVLLSFSPTTSLPKASSTLYLAGQKARENELSSRSRRVLPALMETRSHELPLTAAKPIYLRPRFFPASLLLPSTRSRDPLRNRVCPQHMHTFSLSLFFSVVSLATLLPSHSRADPRIRVHRGSCLTREYFTFPCFCAVRKTKGRPVPVSRMEGTPTRRGKIRFVRIECAIHRNGTLHHLDLTKNDMSLSLNIATRDRE